MRAEIVSVGTELLLGQIVNTNAQFLSQALAELGIDVYYQTVVGDNMNRLLETIELARKRADLIVFTGGLGPTMDDLTRDAVAKYLNRGLTVHEPTMAKLERMFAGRGTAFVESNRRQALLVEGATPLNNETGLAVGSALTADGTHYLLLPGPPREMKPMFVNEATVWLNGLLGQASTLHSVMLRFAGIGESALEDVLIDLIREQTDPTIAPYAKEGEVIVRVSTKDDHAEQAARKMEPVLAEIRKRTANYLYAEEDISIEEAVVRLLSSQGRTLAVAESCTGGMIAEMVTSVPGSSAVFLGGVVSYVNDAKIKLLGVPQALLADGGPGAISGETAAAMADGVRAALDADFGVSITGNAGPSGSENKPVGLVHIGIAGRGFPTRTLQLQFSGDREGIRLRASKRALYALWLAITGRDS
jgi:nicotinamide-nucleotide amidase